MVGLDIEMPKSCWECKLMYGRDEVGSRGDDEPCCVYSGSPLSTGYANCPLKPLPKYECDKWKDRLAINYERIDNLWSENEEIKNKLKIVEKALKNIIKQTTQEFDNSFETAKECQLAYEAYTYKLMCIYEQLIQQAEQELKAEKEKGDDK